MRFTLGLVVLFASSGAFAQPVAFERPKGFFHHPKFLCAALQQNGITTGEWQGVGARFKTRDNASSDPGPYFCEYPERVPQSITTIAPGIVISEPELKLVYRVSGDHQDVADIITIAVTVSRREAMAKGEKEFERHLRLLFKAIEQPLPAGLLPSIARHQYFRSRQPYGLVSFSVVTPELTPNRNVLWFRLRD